MEKGGVTEVGDIGTCKKAKEFGIESKHKTAAVLAQSIFDDKIAKQVEDRAGLLKNTITAERHKKPFVGQDRPALVAQVPAILPAYYQNDLVSEETLKAWGAKANKRYVDIPTR